MNVSGPWNCLGTLQENQTFSTVSQMSRNSDPIIVYGRPQSHVSDHHENPQIAHPSQDLF